ncbi:hypothetical protein ACYSNU_07390 [Enterococcus sp. LJL120]
MIKIIIVSAMVSASVSFGIMKFQMKMIEKWMDIFFEEETERIKNYLSRDK